MKSSLLILFLIFSITLFAQEKSSPKNIVTTIDGKKSTGNIETCRFKKLYIIEEHKESDLIVIPFKDIVKIEGEITSKIKNSILKLNPNVKFTEIEKVLDVEWAYQPEGKRTYKTNNKSNLVIPNYSAGDYLYLAGKRYLIGIGITAGGAALSIIGATSYTPELGIVGGIVALVGVGVSISGHIQLMEAGKALNREAITMSAATEGIGLAINF